MGNRRHWQSLLLCSIIELQFGRLSFIRIYLHFTPILKLTWTEQQNHLKLLWNLTGKLKRIEHLHLNQTQSTSNCAKNQIYSCCVCCCQERALCCVCLENWYRIVSIESMAIDTVNSTHKHMQATRVKNLKNQFLLSLCPTFHKTSICHLPLLTIDFFPLPSIIYQSGKCLQYINL